MSSALSTLFQDNLFANYQQLPPAWTQWTLAARMDPGPN